MAPGLYPLLRSGQINGLIGGLRGAAEYESLIGQKGTAVAGMDARVAAYKSTMSFMENQIKAWNRSDS